MSTTHAHTQELELVGVCQSRLQTCRKDIHKQNHQVKNCKGHHSKKRTCSSCGNDISHFALPRDKKRDALQSQATGLGSCSSTITPKVVIIQPAYCGSRCVDNSIVAHENAQQNKSFDDETNVEPSISFLSHSKHVSSLATGESNIRSSNPQRREEETNGICSKTGILGEQDMSIEPIIAEIFHTSMSEGILCLSLRLRRSILSTATSCVQHRTR
eukprot:c9142_g1_i1.p1 GENE.c9142_g1_i1~~c9142_g1_i1.p1  ORF type:complete len:215 (+),score=48.07 c9142_g1_i1:245-889(+)